MREYSFPDSRRPGKDRLTSAYAIHPAVHPHVKMLLKAELRGSKVLGCLFPSTFLVLFFERIYCQRGEGKGKIDTNLSRSSARNLLTTEEVDTADQ